MASKKKISPASKKPLAKRFKRVLKAMTHSGLFKGLKVEAFEKAEAVKGLKRYMAERDSRKKYPESKFWTVGDMARSRMKRMVGSSSRSEIRKNHGKKALSGQDSYHLGQAGMSGGHAGYGL